MELRASNMERLATREFDVLVLGGGINGAVSAAALSARGASVALVDRGDFAGFTSQNSSNLAWGGIKYMETFEFGLVRKLCRSRNHLMRSYPSTVQEMRFYMVHARGFRHHRLKLYAGTLLYWLMGNLFTRRPRLVPLRTMAREEAIIRREGVDGGLEYSDAFLHDNDARFVWNFVRSALDHGCIAANYVECTNLQKRDNVWVAQMRDTLGGRTWEVKARSIINACGPYVDALNQDTGVGSKHRHVFSKGIHLIVPRLTQNARILTFFADDGRMFFVIPMGPCTCIGTTDTRVDTPETQVEPADRAFVLDNINKRLALKTPLTEKDIIAERCGVRPLAVQRDRKAGKDWMQMSRKHAVEVDTAQRWVSIFGGKLTDCLNVGEEICAAVKRLGVALPYPRARWYGEPSDEVRTQFFHQAKLMNLDGMTSPTSPEPLSQRLWRRYAAQAFEILDAIRRDPRMGQLLIENAEYIRGEIELTRRREMVTTLDDFLRRRSKISLVVPHHALRNAPGLEEACRIFFGDDAAQKLETYFAQHGAPVERTAGTAVDRVPVSA